MLAYKLGVSDLNNYKFIKFDWLLYPISYLIAHNMIIDCRKNRIRI